MEGSCKIHRVSPLKTLASSKSARRRRTGTTDAIMLSAETLTLLSNLAEDVGRLILLRTECQPLPSQINVRGFLDGVIDVKEGGAQYECQGPVPEFNIKTG